MASSAISNRVAGWHAIGVAEAALVDGERPNTCRQLGQDAAEGKPGVRPSVQEHDRLSLGVAGFCIVQAQSVLQTDRTEPNAEALGLTLEVAHHGPAD
jgi:hypothetical protein